MCTCITCNQPATSCSCNTKTDNIKYTGPNLPCADIETGNDLTDVIQKLNDAACNLLTTTTSSTSTSSTSTSSTTTTTTTLNCKVWEAVISQFGINSPPAIILISSTFDEIFVATSYDGVGEYTITFTGAPPLDTCSILTGSSSAGKIFAYPGGPTTIVVSTRQNDGTTPADNILNGNAIRLKTCLNLPPLPTTTTTTTAPPTTTTTSTSTTVAPTTTTTTTLAMVYPVIATCCGQGTTHYINFTAQALIVGDVVTSISEGFLRGYVVQGPAAPGVATIVPYNTSVIPNCAQWNAFWAGFACDPI